MKSSNTQELKIERATEADARLLSVLAGAAFYEAYFEQDDPHDLANYICESFAEDRIISEIADPDATFFIAYRDAKAVGYAKMVDHSRESAIVAKDPIELKRIYVIERAWRQGVGEALLYRCIDAARNLGKDSIWLGVWQMNSRARPFYEKHGFKRVGTIEFPYARSVGINDVMAKTL